MGMRADRHVFLGRLYSLKVLWALLIFTATIYAPLELTRVIIGWGLQGEFLVEVILMWTLYIAGMVIVYKKTAMIDVLSGKVIEHTCGHDKGGKCVFREV